MNACKIILNFFIFVIMLLPLDANSEWVKTNFAHPDVDYTLQRYIFDGEGVLMRGKRATAAPVAISWCALDFMLISPLASESFIISMNHYCPVVES